MASREQNSRAVVAQQPRQDRTSQALVAVTREIDNRMAIVEVSAAAGVSAERLKMVALTVFTRTPALLECEPVSIARALVESAQLGLEPTGLLGGAYLVPRGGKATLLVGYKGLVMLAMRSQLVQRVEARVVREKDELEYAYGLDPYLRHVPSQAADPGPYTGAYAVIFYRDGSRQFDYMSAAEIEVIRKRSSSGSSGPWVTDTAEMYKKTPLRRLMKLAPLTIEVAQKLDELDPEVPEDHGTARQADTRQAALRQQLQAQLSADAGVVEGTARELPAEEQATTQAASAGTAGGQAPGAEGEAASTAEPTAPRAARQRAAAAAEEPAAVAAAVDPAPATAACAMVHEGLGVGPCVLPADHPTNEHEEAGGTRWSQGRAK
jgi:recombination protein RecT